MSNIMIVSNLSAFDPPQIINPNNETYVELMLGVSIESESVNAWVKAGTTVGQELSIRLISRPNQDNPDAGNNKSSLVLNSLPANNEPNPSWAGFIYSLFTLANYLIPPFDGSNFFGGGYAFINLKWTGSHWLLVHELIPVPNPES